MAQFTTTVSTGSSTTTSSTPTTKVTHTVTSPTSRTYIIFFSAEIISANTATRCKVDLLVDGATVVTFSPRVMNNAEDDTIFFFERVTGKVSNFDCVIQFASTDNTNTVTILNARIVAWDYTDVTGLDLQYNAADPNTTLPTSFDTTGATSTFTPGSQGNYFVLGCGAISPGSISEESIARLGVDSAFFPFLTDTVSYWAREAPAVVAAAYYSFAVGTRQNLTAASHTVRVSMRQETTGSLGSWRYTRVLAFREDAFTSSNYTSADTGAEDANTTTTYETRATVTTTDPGVGAKDYLILAGQYIGQSGDTAEAERSQTHIRIDTVEQIMMEYRPKDLTDHMDGTVAVMKNTADAFTVDTQHRLQNDLDNTSQAKDSWIIILRDDVVAGSVIKTIDTIAIASVKTRDTIAIASVKTVDTISNV